MSEFIQSWSFLLLAIAGALVLGASLAPFIRKVWWLQPSTSTSRGQCRVCGLRAATMADARLCRPCSELAEVDPYIGVSLVRAYLSRHRYTHQGLVSARYRHCSELLEKLEQVLTSDAACEVVS